VIVRSIAPLLQSSAIEPIPTLSHACACLVRSCMRVHLSDRQQCACTIDRTSVAIEHTCSKLLHFYAYARSQGTCTQVHLNSQLQQTRGSVCVQFSFLLLFCLIINLSLIIYLFCLFLFVYLLLLVLVNLFLFLFLIV
jgi:hypothetical protein